LSSKLMRGVVVLVFVLVAGAAPQLRPALADACQQPADNGCPVEMNQAVTTVLVDPNTVHTWRFTLIQPASVHLALTHLPADYDLHVYTGDGTLVGESTNEGTQDDMVDLSDTAADTYMVYVNSPRGEVDPTHPYTLEVDVPASAGAAVAPETTSANLAAVGNGDPGPAPAYPVTGQVVLADNFDDPTHGWLPSSSPNPGFESGYLDGEYRLSRTAGGVGPWSFLPGTYANATLSVDARLVGVTPGRFVEVHCRSMGALGYRFQVEPDQRQFKLVRSDGPGKPEVNLTDLTPTPIINRGNSWNHLEITCIGDTITGSINGVQVVIAHDSTYTQGNLYISGREPGPIPGPLEARFANLVVTRP
jgi:hypothetical protein